MVERKAGTRAITNYSDVQGVTLADQLPVRGQIGFPAPIGSDENIVFDNMSNAQWPTADASIHAAEVPGPSRLFLFGRDALQDFGWPTARASMGEVS